MDVSLLSTTEEIQQPVEPIFSQPQESHIDKIGDVMTMGTLDQVPMEIVDTTTNEHYMLLVDAKATLKTIEPQIKKLTNTNENSLIHLIFESRVLAVDEYVHPLISERNNTFYLVRKSSTKDTLLPTKDTTQFLSYENKIATLNTEITEYKVKLVSQQHRIEELTDLLHKNNIPLPEEEVALEKKEQKLIELKKEEEKKDVMKEAVVLQWTDQGVEGIKNLITEINNFTYTNLEVLDLSDLHMGDEGCKLLASVFSQGWSLVNILQFYFSPPTLPRLHSIILYGNDITKEGANALLSAFKYLPQVELLGLEVLKRRLSTKEVQIFQQLQLDVQLFTSTALDLANLNLVDNFLVQFSGYVDYLISGDKTTIHNRFKSRGVMKLASVIANGNIPNLEVLNLEDNEIDEEAILFLACCFTKETTPNIHEFHLGGNAIGDKGVSTLFRYFRKNTINSMTSLYLDRIQMAYEGIKFISNSVLFHTMENLNYLNIAGNNIQSKGFIILLKSIERGGFPKLEELIVSDNRIGNDGCQYLLSVLARGPLGSLKRIDLSFNSISKEMQSTCLQTLAGQTQLSVVFQVKRLF